jgi:hypothetical protein
MTLLQIDITGVDADGNTAIATVEVPVADAPAVSADVIPPTHVPAPAPPQPVVPTPPPAGAAVPASPEGTEPGTAGAQDQRGMAMEGEMPVLADQPVQIAGLGNATGHQAGTVAKPVVVTQAVRSTTLFKNTGGFR